VTTLPWRYQESVSVTDGGESADGGDSEYPEDDEAAMPIVFIIIKAT